MIGAFIIGVLGALTVIGAQVGIALHGLGVITVHNGFQAWMGATLSGLLLILLAAVFGAFFDNTTDERRQLRRQHGVDVANLKRDLDHAKRDVTFLKEQLEWAKAENAKLNAKLNRGLS